MCRRGDEPSPSTQRAGRVSFGSAVERASREMKQLRSCCVQKSMDFGLEHDCSEDFAKSQWQRRERSVLYLVYRWVLALGFTALFVACCALQFSEGKLFIYLTNWGVIMYMVTHVIGAVVVTMWHFRVGIFRENNSKLASGNQTHPLLKLYWLLHSISVALALTISFIYWVFLYGKNGKKPIRYHSLNILTHAANSLLMAVDVLTVSFPWRFAHIAYAMLFSTVYSLFTVVYYLLGGTDEYGNPFVYTILHWGYPSTALMTFLGVFCLYFIVGVVIQILYKLRAILMECVCCDRMGNAADII